MLRNLIEFGNFKIPSFGVMVMLGVFLGMLVARKRAPRFGINGEHIIDLSMWMLGAGVVGARLAYIVTHMAYYRENSHELWQLQLVGMTSFGGLILGSIPLILYCRKHKVSILKMLDIFAPSLLIAHAIGRIGCLLNGCCYGHECTLPWAIAVQDEAGLRHPTQVYDLLLNFLWLGIYYLVQPKFRLTGQHIGFAFVGHGLARIVTEIWRNGATAKPFLGMPFTEAQFAAAMIVLIGAVILIRAKEPQPASILQSGASL